MKIFTYLSAITFFLMFSGQNTASAVQSNELSGFEPGDNKIEVYYFHYTRRCATCNAVEDETKKVLEKHFSDEEKSGDITFLSVNIEEESNAILVDELEVSGQALLFVCGDKKIDLTNDAFMNARTKPEKFQKQVKKTIEQLME